MGRKKRHDAYPVRTTRTNKIVESVELPSSTIITNRHTLNAVAMPPAPRMPITLNLFAFAIWRFHTNSIGTMRINKSLVILITESAVMTFC